MPAVLVKLRIPYKTRDAKTFELRAEKRFDNGYVPPVDSDIYVEGKDIEVSGHVTSVWWQTTTDTVIVHAHSGVHSDGNVTQEREDHKTLLESKGWTCKQL